jgi:SulP family sulfate permease
MMPLISPPPRQFSREVLSGVVVSLATIPTSAAYSALIGLNPLVGIWSSVIVGSVVGILAGGPGVIAGAAGVIAIPLSKLVKLHGLSYMAPAVLLAGLMEMVFGLLNLGSLVSFVTAPVVAGFLNSFALFLLKSQIKFFQSGGQWLPAASLHPALCVATICIALIRLTPLVTRAVPAALVGLVVSSLAAVASGLPLKSLADVSGAELFRGGLASLPRFSGLPTVPLTLATLRIVLPTAVGITMISLVETLLARRVACDTIDDESAACPADEKSQNEAANESAVALGLGNALSSLFGGFGGCGLIPNTVLNSRNGGHTAVSSVAYAVSLSLAVLLFAPIIGRIPVAALAGNFVGGVILKQ